MNRMVSPEFHARVMELHKAGYTRKAIAQALGVTYRVVRRIFIRESMFK